jgi:hypothetical protein
MFAARLRNLLVATLFLASLTSALAKDTLYVDGVHGDDNNSCRTRQTACKTIGHAISLASSGDCIRVAPTTYTENLTINLGLTIIGAGANTTIVDGGGKGTVVTVNAGDFRVALSKLTMQDGSANESGGGIYNGAKLTVSHCTISGNSAGGGGGIENAGTLTIDKTTVSSNRVGSTGGGGIENDGTLSINRSTVSGNVDFDPYADGGGGIFNRSGTLLVKHSTISGNTAAGGTGGGHGGGILNGSTLVVSDSTITNNKASGGSGGTGGGIENDTGATMTISRTAIVANTAEHLGGGIMNYGALMLNNSTLVENTATCGATCGGGGIANGYGGTVAINNSTISGNGAPNFGYAGGIYNISGTVALQNSIVANSTSGGNCSYGLTSGGYNISDDNTCDLGGPGDMNSTNPELQPLGNYGGPTETIAIYAGSPAIDAGNPNGCTNGDGHQLKTDQRGYPRPGRHDHHGCDIGAFENQKH